MPELQDLYDIHRCRTGKVIERGTPRRPGEFVLVVHLLIFDAQGRFLVQRRVDTKSSWPGMWDISLGGMAQSGDDSRRAAEREAFEELGLSLDLSDTEPVFSFRTETLFDDYWLVRLETPSTLKLQPEEVAEARWVDRAEWDALVATHQVIPYSFQNILFSLYEHHFPGTRLFSFGDPVQIRGAVFDMDGLLLDTERVADRSWEKAAAEFGLSDFQRTLNACRGLNEASTRAYFLTHFGEDFDYAGFRARASALSHAVTDAEVPVKAGAAAILQSLRDRSIRLALASSTREVTVRDQLSRAGLLPLFDVVITGDMVSRGKPDPEIYLRACEALELAPENCIALEDSVNGLRSAYRAGTFPVQIPDVQPPCTESNALAWKTFASLAEAEAWLFGSGLL